MPILNIIVLLMDVSLPFKGNWFESSYAVTAKGNIGQEHFVYTITGTGSREERVDVPGGTRSVEHQAARWHLLLINDCTLMATGPAR